MFAWEDVKAMFNGGSRKRVAGSSPGGSNNIPVVTSTSSQSSSGTESVAKPTQEVAQQTKPAKTLKNPCASKRPKFESSPLAKIRQPEVVPTAAGTSTSSSPGPNPTPSPLTPQIYHHPNQQPQTLLARLNSIVPTAGSLITKPATTDPPLQDYSMMWGAAGTGRFWSPYLNPLPFHPYSYYNYLINKTDQFSLMMNPSGGGWQQLVTSKPRISPVLSIQKAGLLEDNKSIQQMQESPIDEEEVETFVDVESTDPAIAN